MRIGHSMKDLQKIARLVQKTFGYTPTLLSLHGDEGHYLCDESEVEILDSDGNKTFIANIHGHLRFNILDPENGKSLYREAMKDPNRLEKIRKFQDEVAQILGMQRGIDKRISGRERIPWTFGTSPKYTLKRTRRFPIGEIELRIEVRDNIIRDVVFFGDFFTSQEIDPIVDALRGSELETGALTAALRSIDWKAWFPTIQEEDFAAFVTQGD